jgi:lipooligosaccharide transport system permease protein
MASPTIAVLERHLLLYRRLWRASAVSMFVMPVLFLASMGLGVGGLVHTVDGVDYVRWIAPALLVSTVFQIGVSESTYGILSDFEWAGGLHAMRGTSVRIKDMVTGWLLYVLVMAELAVMSFTVVMAAFGVLRPLDVAIDPFVGALVALSAAAPTMALSAGIRRDDWFLLLTRFVVLPMTLFSGVFFPLDRLPALIRPIGYLSPLWNGVQLTRTTVSGTGSWPLIAVHAGYLLLCTMAGYFWAQRAFRRRLAD